MCLGRNSLGMQRLFAGVLSATRLFDAWRCVTGMKIRIRGRTTDCLCSHAEKRYCYTLSIRALDSLNTSPCSLSLLCALTAKQIHVHIYINLLQAIRFLLNSTLRTPKFRLDTTRIPTRGLQHHNNESPRTSRLQPYRSLPLLIQPIHGRQRHNRPAISEPDRRPRQPHPGNLPPPNLQTSNPLHPRRNLQSHALPAPLSRRPRTPRLSPLPPPHLRTPPRLPGPKRRFLGDTKRGLDVNP